MASVIHTDNSLAVDPDFARALALLYYNLEMLTGFPFGDAWKNNFVKALSDTWRMNQFMTNWPVVLEALRQLWESGKVSELKSPFYEPFVKPAAK